LVESSGILKHITHRSHPTTTHEPKFWSKAADASIFFFFTGDGHV
jgi:hypothetical protein